LNCKAICREETMRIHSNPGSEPLESGRVESQNSANASAASRSATAQSQALGEDQAQLSGTHVQVQALAAQASQLPEVRQEKVSALRQAILGGSYHPDPEQVADALLSHMYVQAAA